MEEDIQNYSPTGFFRGTPYIFVEIGTLYIFVEMGTLYIRRDGHPIYS